MPATKRPKRKYTEAFKAKALAALDANGGNVWRTAKEVGIPTTTLERWAKDQDAVPPDVREEKRKELAAELEGFVIGLCNLRAKSLEGLNVRDTAVAIGIGVDKLLLLKGQPNQISRNESDGQHDLSKLSPAELRTIADLYAKARGEPVPEEASDLSRPVIYRDSDEAV